ncbi:MAG: calcium/sodium antiporter [Hyphomicrobiales bacterium]|nr:calcium/sodium antiporter [Hyphomicrobiales bacterium]
MSCRGMIHRLTFHEHGRTSLLTMLTLSTIIGGLALLLLGGDVLVKGALVLARRFHVPQAVIGVTIVAFGTSAPEMMVSFQAAWNGVPDIVIGNIIGSNIGNILLVLGVTAMIFPFAADERIARYDGIIMLLTALCFSFFLFSGLVVWWHGVILFGGFLLYAAAEIHTRMQSQPDQTMHEEAEEIAEHMPKTRNPWLGLLMAIAGVLILIFGSDLLIRGAVEAARGLGISEAVIGATLVAVGSSAPELAASVMAAFRKHSAIALANVVGSNILNILVGIGGAALITSLPVSTSFLRIDVWYMLIATLALFVLMRIPGNISRITGGLFFLGYIGYILTLFLNG